MSQHEDQTMTSPRNGGIPMTTPHTELPGCATVLPWIWRNRFTPNLTEDGALIRRGAHKVFVRADDLRAVADALHEVADRLEAGL